MTTDDPTFAAHYPRSPYFQDPTALTDKAIEKAIRHISEKSADQREFLIEKIDGSIAIIKARLDGNDTALVAALAAAGKAAEKQTENFTAILDESKRGSTKQIDALNEKIDDLKERMSVGDGRNNGISSSVAMVIAVIATAAAVLLVVCSAHTTPANSMQHVLYTPAAYVHMI